MADKAKKDDPNALLEYQVQSAFWDGPHLCGKDETVWKTREQAKYFTPHILRLVQETPNPTPSEPTSEANKPAKGKKKPAEEKTG